MSTLGGDELPVVAGTRDAPLASLFSDGLLQYQAFILNKLSAAVDKIIPRNESNPQQTAFEMVPAANRYPLNPFERRRRHLPLRTPSLWMWWHGTSKRTQITTAFWMIEREYRMMWIMPELPASEDLALRANIWQLIDSQLMEGSDDQWQPGFEYNGSTAGDSLVRACSPALSKQAAHDAIDWQYMGGTQTRIGAEDANQSNFGEKTSGRDYAAFVAIFRAHMKMTISIPSKVTAEADSTFDITANGADFLTGIVPAVAPGTPPIEQPEAIGDALKLWLRADTLVTADDDTDVVSMWRDVRGHHVAQSSTGQTLVLNAINGHPVIRFDGVDDVMTIPHHDDHSAGAGDGLIVMAVVNYISTNGDTVLAGKTNNATGNNWRMFRLTGLALGMYFGTDAESYPLPSATAPNGINQIVSWEQDVEASKLRTRANGAATDIDVTLSGTGTGLNPLTIGGSDPYFSNVDLAELVVYKKSGENAVSDADEALLVAYFNDRYAL